jgi:TRAP-type C4-dicarboxylate transport system permease small subunit
MSTEQTAPPSRFDALFYIGSIALVLATAVEVIAVLGRHTGVPFLGALEIIQTCILLMAASAMLSATLHDAHATVHILTNRLSPRARGWLLRFSSLLSACFFVGLFAGSLILMLDYWNAHEESELLRIPFRPLRVVSTLAVIAIALVFLWRAVRPSRTKDVQ